MIVDLLSIESVQKSIGLNADDFGIVEYLLSEGNIRWGLDKSHRKDQINIDMSPYMTWRYGLDRLLLGYATGDSEWYDTKGGEDPVNLYSSDCAEDSSAVILGKLTKFVDRLRYYKNLFSEPKQKALNEWHSLLIDMLDEFFVPTESTYKEISRIRKAVYDLKSLAINCDIEGEGIDYEVVVMHLEKVLNTEVSNSPLNENSVVFCQLRPMNSRPAEVTCLLGLNDGVFPRSDNKPTFDLLRQSRRRGDRSLRSDDRCAFLESVINARKKLYLSYTGRTDKANEVVPSSIVLQEMRDCLSARFDIEKTKFHDGTEGFSFETLHRLNAIHPDYFNGNEKLFSFSKPNLLATQYLVASLQGEMEDQGQDKPYSPLAVISNSGEKKEIDLEELKKFFVNPAKHYYTKTLGVYFDIQESELPADDEPMISGGLESYKIKQEIMRKLKDECDMNIDLVNIDDLI
jgi:exodeoxyribonuclease V gamma subunit